MRQEGYQRSMLLSELSEKIIAKSQSALYVDSIILVKAHHLSTIGNSDKIIYANKDKLLYQGNFDKVREIWKTLCHRQSPLGFKIQLMKVKTPDL